MQKKVLKFSASECWKVSAPKDAAPFLRALADLAPEGSILYLESGGSPPDPVKLFLLSIKLEDHIGISGGTLLPTPRIYKFPLTRGNLETLAQLQEKYPTPVGSVHIHIYKGEKVLLWGYDAFLDPIFISKAIPEKNVRTFCRTLGLRRDDAEN